MYFWAKTCFDYLKNKISCSYEQRFPIRTKNVFGTIFRNKKKKSFATLNLTLTSSTYYISSYFLWNGLLVPYKRHSHNIIAILFRFPSLLIAMSSLPTHLIITFFLNSNLASYCIYNFHCECEFLDRNGILQKLKKICYSSNNK